MKIDKKYKPEKTSNREEKKLEKEIKRLERKIEETDTQIKGLELKIQNPSSLSENEKNELYFEHAEKSREAEELMEKWEKKSLEIEALKN